jgi:ubiquinone/menaquinone biosynthesis C-methylase UbiE
MADDVYTRLNELDESTLRAIANVLEIRARHPQQIAIRAAYLDALGDIAGQRVLEIGCGTGPVTRELAARVGPGGYVTGTDPTYALIEVAERVGAEQGIENVSFEVQDGRSLPYPDDTFDLRNRYEIRVS